tara:strand:+ start:3296 stop:3955 length:660 start_codon:yes stop_codon:yes gene_type:complete
MTAFERAWDVVKAKIPMLGETQRLDWSQETGQDFDDEHWSGDATEGQAWLESPTVPSEVYVGTILNNIMGIHPDDPAEREMTDDEIELATKRISSTGQHEALHSALEHIFRDTGFSTPEAAFGDNRIYNLGHEYGAIAGSTESPIQQMIQLLTHSTLGDYQPLFNERMKDMFAEARKATGGHKFRMDDPVALQAIREWRGRRARANALEQDPSLGTGLP